MFCLRLSMALGRTLAEVLAMSAFELVLWLEYYQRYGFAVDRLEWTTAASGSVVARSMGAKIDAADLVPRFVSRRAKMDRLKSWLESV